MANWYGTARTNFVRFADQKAFNKARRLTEKLGMTWHKHGDAKLTAMISGDDDSGGFNLYDSDRDIEHEWFEFAELLADGQILVGMVAGAEKLRYVDGYAFAINKQGEMVDIHLNEIYALAEKKFGTAVAPAAYQEIQPTTEP